MISNENLSSTFPFTHSTQHTAHNGAAWKIVVNVIETMAGKFVQVSIFGCCHSNIYTILLDVFLFFWGSWVFVFCGKSKQGKSINKIGRLSLSSLCLLDIHFYTFDFCCCCRSCIRCLKVASEYIFSSQCLYFIYFINLYSFLLLYNGACACAHSIRSKC